VLPFATSLRFQLLEAVSTKSYIQDRREECLVNGELDRMLKKPVAA